MRPYVPILLAKRGERQALELVGEGTRSLFTPWLRVVSSASESDGSDTSYGELRRIARVSTDEAVYLDAVGLQRRSRSRPGISVAFMQRLYQAAIEADLAFLPVYRFGRTDLLRTISDFQSLELGAAVLVRHDDALVMGVGSFEHNLREQVRSLAIEPARLDVMVDLGYIPPDSANSASVVWLVRKVIGAFPWRSLILAGTAVPESFAGEIQDDRVGWVERREATLFDAVQREIEAELRFADYAVQSPNPPGNVFMARARANIRYTSGGAIYVSRGGRPMGEIPRTEWPAEYRRVASRLVTEAPFAGDGCCWGDQFVAMLADGRRDAKSHHWMRAAATCHHLTFVAQERATGRRAQAEIPMTRLRRAANRPPDVPSRSGTP